MVNNKSFINQNKRIELILELQSRLDEAEQTLTAIQNGEIDAIVAPNGSDGSKGLHTGKRSFIFTEILVQEMNEGVATLTYDGIILYSNTKLASMLQNR